MTRTAWPHAAQSGSWLVTLPYVQKRQRGEGERAGSEARPGAPRDTLLSARPYFLKIA